MEVLFCCEPVTIRPKEIDLLPCVTFTHTDTEREERDDVLDSGQDGQLREIYLNWLHQWVSENCKNFMDLGGPAMNDNCVCSVTLLFGWPPSTPRSTQSYHMKSMNMCIDFH